MGKSDRMTDEELEYIRAVYPDLGPSEIARRLGRSLSAVKARIKQMGLTKEEGHSFKVLRVDKSKEPQDTYDRLVELRGILRRQLVDAPPSCIAALSKEYRAVLQDIDSFEKGDSQSQSNPLEQIAKAISNGV